METTDIVITIAGTIVLGDDFPCRIVGDKIQRIELAIDNARL